MGSSLFCFWWRVCKCFLRRNATDSDASCESMQDIVKFVNFQFEWLKRIDW